MHGLGIQFSSRVARQVGGLVPKHYLGVLFPLFKLAALLLEPTFSFHR